MPRTMTARIGPTEHSATRPKLSASLFSSLRVAAMPMPNAMIKGTVMGPVVTPPASNATGRKSPGTKKEMINTTAYRPISR